MIDLQTSVYEPDRPFAQVTGQALYYLLLFDCCEVLMMFEIVNTVVF